MLKGIAASPGMVIGRSVVLALESLDINMRLLNFDEVQGELERLGIAIEQSKIQLQQVLELALREVGPEEARIFEAQALILDDYLLLTTIKNSITEERINVEAAVDRAIQMFASVMEGAADDYTRERALDIRDVGRRLIRNLLGHDPQPIQPLDEPAVIFAYDLSPSDTVSLDKSMVLGFATELGGKTSHTAILAKSLGIPAVVGVGPKLREVGSRSQVILDGNLGQIFLNPSKDLVGIYHQRIEEEHRRKERLARLRDLPAVTLDGFRVSLEGNIGTSADLDKVMAVGAEGIGIFRTEFLFMDRSEMPSEEEQFLAYKEVVEKMGGPVTIRTLDIGGDKQLPYLRLDPEINPDLGYRALRITLKEKEIFRTQLRAILRASAFGRVRITFPMVSSVEEMRAAKQLLGEVMKQLQAEAVDYDQSLEVGIMVEVPSAALIADTLIKEVDFFSLGTNDLTQYTIAVDRMNERVADLYQPFSPSVLRLIKMVVDAAHKAGKWAGMCGEMAGDVLAVPFLIALGIDELSMNATSIPMVKQAIRRSVRASAAELTERLVNAATAAEVRGILAESLSDIAVEH